jgi:hypothetical protein
MRQKVNTRHYDATRQVSIPRSAFGNRSDSDETGNTGLFMVVIPYTLIGATSIQRSSRQLCSAHSASCTPLAPSSSVYLYGASSQT